MRLAVLSDVHANLDALRAVLGDLRAAGGVDRVISLGDVVGYNADPEACLDLLGEAGAICIAGNHDLAVAGLLPVDGFSPAAIRAVAWTRERLGPAHRAMIARWPLQATLGEVVAVHGSLLPGGRGCPTTRLDADERRAACLAALAAHPAGATVCVFGHTHRLGTFEQSGDAVRALTGDAVRLDRGARHLINPGSVGEPRTEEQRATWLLLDTERRTVSFRRVAYDRAAVLARTRAAGLIAPHRRLPPGLRAVLRTGLRVTGLTGVALRAWETHERRRARSGAP